MTDPAPLGEYAALAEQAASDRQSANERFQEARAASEKAALRELVFTAASYGVTRLLLEPSDQGDYMTVSEIEPEVDSEAEDIISDSGAWDMSDYSHADWAGETGVEVEEFSHRDDQIRKASIDVKVAAEALIAATSETEEPTDTEDVHPCSRCGSRVRWNGQKWSTVDEPAGECLPGLGLDHRVAPTATIGGSCTTHRGNHPRTDTCHDWRPVTPTD